MKSFSVFLLLSSVIVSRLGLVLWTVAVSLEVWVAVDGDYMVFCTVRIHIPSSITIPTNNKQKQEYGDNNSNSGRFLKIISNLLMKLILLLHILLILLFPSPHTLTIGLFILLPKFIISFIWILIILTIRPLMCIIMLLIVPLIVLTVWVLVLIVGVLRLVVWVLVLIAIVVLIGVLVGVVG